MSIREIEPKYNETWSKIPWFVPFWVNLAHFGPKYGLPGEYLLVDDYGGDYLLVEDYGGENLLLEDYYRSDDFVVEDYGNYGSEFLVIDD